MILRPRLVAFLAAAAVLLAAPAAPASAASGKLRAGAGQSDITPPKTGYYLGGYTRADRLALGQHTRLFAKAIVLERGGRKLALVSIDLFMIPAGMQEQAARMAGRDFDQRNVLVLPTHTHSGPGGFANFPTYNTAAPSADTITDPISYYELLDPQPADPQLYTFLTRQIARAIRRAERDVGPAAAGWGRGRIENLTRNRSVEAHLANHGVEREYGEGSAREDPEGELHTIDPRVDVLRVDRIGRGRRIPLGAFSSFANHGTVVKALFQAYNGDHHASAHRIFEERVRRAGNVPRGRAVVNVYGNSNEGDMSAGMDHSGPAGADRVGRVEAKEMLRAWRRAGRGLSRRPALDLRWTRVCFCGQEVEGGRVAESGRPGAPFFTGSEEERGPLYDVTGVPFEGKRGPESGDQGHKIVVPGGEFPEAVPIAVARLGDRVIAALPGEPTKEIGTRVRRAVLRETRSTGVRDVVIAGLTNDFISYITTPEEYSRQHYEGGSTLYGPLEGVFFTERLVELSSSLASGRPAPAPHPFDAQNGVFPNGPPYPRGAREGRLVEQPQRRVRRLGHARLAWQGGELGRDRPIGKPFIVVERRTRRGWRRVDSDLGLSVLWRVDDEGNYDAYWEVPLRARGGRHRLVVSADRYRLKSRPFRVAGRGTLSLRELDAAANRVAVRLDYPRERENVDLRARPRSARGGVVRFRVGERKVAVRRRRGAVFVVAAPPGVPVTIAPGAARDRFGNSNRAAVALRPDGR